MTSSNIKLSEIMLSNFQEVHKHYKKGDYLKYILKGGRNSGKSSHIAIELILDIVKYPITILCVRKVERTLQESCYEQLKEAIDILGLDDKFVCKLSPLKIIYKPRGNSIIFRGADDPAKIKSIKVSKFPIARLWIEELAEFKTEDEVSMIENSVLRATLPEGLFYAFFYSYNPPKRKQSWVNKRYETQFLAKNTFVHHSDYRSNKYVSKEFIEEAEEIKSKRPMKYRWEYLGEPVGSGVVPFDNLVFRTITDDEIKSFDNIRQGIDWGYAADAFHFGREHYDKKKRILYLFDEIHRVKLSNRLAAQIIKERGYNDCKIIADSSEPKSIDELTEYGLRVYGANKRPGSVEYGEKWLDDLEAIIIDPKRCPKTAKEFENIDYKTDKDGNTLSRLEDKDNHSVDALRYALSEDMNSSRFSFE